MQTFIVKLNLVIEIDGISHSFAEVAAKDSKKQAYLESMGLTILRFTEKEVIFNRSQVVQAYLYADRNYRESLS